MFIPTTADIKDAASSTGISPIDDPEFTRWLHLHDSEIIAYTLSTATTVTETEGVDALRTLRDKNAEFLTDLYRKYIDDE